MNSPVRAVAPIADKNADGSKATTPKADIVEVTERGPPW